MKLLRSPDAKRTMKHSDFNADRLSLVSDVILKLKL